MNRKNKSLTPEKFRSLPAIERRKLIAKDALAQLRTKKYSATCDNYASTYENMPGKLKDDLRTVLRKRNMPTCFVCAKGALFLSQIRLGDEVELSQKISYTQYDGLFLHTGDPKRKLDFPIGMSREIERALEGCNNALRDAMMTDDERLMAILEDIAKHGNFKYERCCQANNIEV